MEDARAHVVVCHTQAYPAAAAAAAGRVGGQGREGAYLALAAQAMERVRAKFSGGSEGSSSAVNCPCSALKDSAFSPVPPVQRPPYVCIF